MKILHLTDLHIVPEGTMLKYADPGQELKLAIEFINQSHRDADLCVITGDLADRGDEASYAYLHTLLDELQVDYQLLLGNHDNRDNFKRVFPSTAIDENGFVQSYIETEVGVLLFLDTLQQGTHAGSLCELRQAWIKKQLDMFENTPIYIFMHHPPLRLGIGDMDQYALMQRDEFAKLLHPYHPHIRHICFGHIHRQVSGFWQNISYSANQGVSAHCWQKPDSKTGVDAFGRQMPDLSVFHFSHTRSVLKFENDCNVDEPIVFDWKAQSKAGSAA